MIGSLVQCRLWNQQYISFAGYKLDDGTIVGDPANVEFTTVCEKLGMTVKYMRNIRDGLCILAPTRL